MQAACFEPADHQLLDKRLRSTLTQSLRGQSFCCRVVAFRGARSSPPPRLRDLWCLTEKGDRSRRPRSILRKRLLSLFQFVAAGSGCWLGHTCSGQFSSSSPETSPHHKRPQQLKNALFFPAFVGFGCCHSFCGLGLVERWPHGDCCHRQEHNVVGGVHSGHRARVTARPVLSYHRAHCRGGRGVGG